MTQEINLKDIDFSDIFSKSETQLSEIAYVKKEIVGIESVWTIYSERGEKMGYAANREIALAMARQSEFTVHNVH